MSNETHVVSGMLHTGFFQQVQSYPDRIAIITSDRRISYGELAMYSQAICNQLQKLNVESNTLVAVHLEKGWMQVAATLGILQAGAAYLPIDPHLPETRKGFLLEQGEVKIVLSQSLYTDLSRLQHLNLQVLNIEEFTSGLVNGKLTFVEQKPNDLAYIIFTSGSTGQPKGVALQHAAVVNTILDINTRFNITHNDSVLALSALNFDLSVYDIFGLLAVGGKVVIPSETERLEPKTWIRFIENEKITIWSVIYPITHLEMHWKSIPYGKSLKNQTIEVLNEDFQRCAIGVSGEIYIGGVGLAREYWRDKEKTEESFVQDPHTKQRLYKTGDLGCYMPDGNIEFLGRKDFQVKINGHRIELGEIEITLLRYKDVEQAHIIFHENQLVAFIVTKSNISTKSIIDFLQKALPSYMIPSQIRFLDEAPLTENGKLDRGKLVDLLKTPNEIRDMEFISPRNEMEEKMLSIWEDTFNQKSISIRSNYFNLGGNSLLAASLIGKVNSVFNIDLPLSILFSNSTIERLVQTIQHQQVPSGLVLLNSEGRERPFVNDYLFSLATNKRGRNSELLILSAKNIDLGPLCIIQIPHHIPNGFHGCWVDLDLT